MTTTARPVVPVRPVGPGRAGRAQPPGPNPWRPGQLLLAPHRLAFFLAMVLLLASGLWWALVQVDRTTGAIGLGYAVPPTITHAAVMSFGFMPLFFAGFHPAALPQRVVGVVDRQTRQLHLPALAVRGVELHQFLDHDLHRPTIGNDVVHAQGQSMAVLSGSGFSDVPDRVIVISNAPMMINQIAKDIGCRLWRMASVMDMEICPSCRDAPTEGQRDPSLGCRIAGQCATANMGPPYLRRIAPPTVCGHARGCSGAQTARAQATIVAIPGTELSAGARVGLVPINGC